MIRLFAIFILSLLSIYGRCGLAAQSRSYDNSYEYLSDRIALEQSLVLVANRDDVVPLTSLDMGRFALITVGELSVFSSRINDFLEMPVISFDDGFCGSLTEALQNIELFDRIILGVDPSALTSELFEADLIRELSDFAGERESVAVFFGKPGEINGLTGFENFDGLVVANDNSPLSQDFSAQLVFGAIGASGTLSENVGDHFQAGWGLKTEGGLRLKYTVPEELGVDGSKISENVDSIVNSGLNAGAFPGCRVFLAIDGRVIFDEAYGFHTYSGRVAVEKGDLYDLASVTKISGPLPLYMRLVDKGRIDLDNPVSYYWDDWQNRLFRRSNKQDLVLRDLLTHQSGIVPYLNYWENTIRDGNYRRWWYRHEPLNNHNLKLESHLYLRDNFRNRVYRDIRRSDLLSHGVYRYSCLPFIISPEVISAVDGRPYKDALYTEFFNSLGASTLRYNPLNYFSAGRIVPTEFDNHFRRVLVHGYVHDEASAVLGGISGNAGLFSTAGDLAKLLQMYLNGGEYGGVRYLSTEVLSEFTAVQFPENNNRRGLGFDKPVLDNHKRPPERAYPCPGASPSSYGHSGFTGTFVWVDPEYQLLYIFLSNRVHPTRSNNLISSMNIRTEILQVFYDALK